MQTISIAEAARQTGFSPNTVRKWVEAGTLPAKIFPGGRKRIAAEDLQRFIDDLPFVCSKSEVSAFPAVVKTDR